jgi:hypothetical protein
VAAPPNSTFRWSPLPLVSQRACVWVPLSPLQAAFTSVQQTDEEMLGAATSLVQELQHLRERRAAAQASAKKLRDVVVALANRQVLA